MRTGVWNNVVNVSASDLRHAMRRLRRAPGFTALCALTLAVGIGASTAIFSAVNPILFEPIPYPQPDRILAIWDYGVDGSHLDVTFGTYREVAQRSRTLDSIAVMKPWQPTVTGSDQPERLDGQRVTTRIPVGVHDGQKIRVAGKGRPGANGGPAGDLLLTVRVGGHPVFSADGLNLRVTVPVTYPEAALGATIDVPTLAGDTVRVKVPGGTSSGQVLRVKGRGLQGRDKTGDLHVVIQVDIPRKLSRHAKHAVEALAEQLGDNPRESLLRDAAR